VFLDNKLLKELEEMEKYNDMVSSVVVVFVIRIGKGLTAVLARITHASRRNIGGMPFFRLQESSAQNRAAL
jgi:hypothetical protein